jgi:signal peptidase
MGDSVRFRAESPTREVAVVKVVRLIAMFLVPTVLLGAFLFLRVESSKYEVYVIHTGSMRPTIPSGSAVLVRKGHYRIGQVITFTEDNLTVTHRLVSISSTGLTTTKGDGNPTVDPWHVPTRQIIGGVVYSAPYVGYWIWYFKNPIGSLSVFLAVLVVWEIWALARNEATTTQRRAPRHRRVPVDGFLLGDRVNLVSISAVTPWLPPYPGSGVETNSPRRSLRKVRFTGLALHRGAELSQGRWWGI